MKWVSHDPAAQAIGLTQAWVQQAVIGLNLCPFAKSVYIKNQIHYAVTLTPYADVVLDVLRQELHDLQQAPPAVRDTTLLITPLALEDFYTFNAFLKQADAVLVDMGLEGEVQIASFHPDYEFSDAPPDATSHCTNRSPYPCLHLLRESSIEKAVAAFPDASLIYEKNRHTLQALGQSGWERLAAQFSPPSEGLKK